MSKELFVPFLDLLISIPFSFSSSWFLCEETFYSKTKYLKLPHYHCFPLTLQVVIIFFNPLTFTLFGDFSNLLILDENSDTYPLDILYYLRIIQAYDQFFFLDCHTLFQN